MGKQKNISNDLEITAYFHCTKCLEEMPDGISPQNWARNETGFTPQGIQVWCLRHNANIMHIDFQGQQHPANTTAKDDSFVN